mgnify:CR=1 FL=1
MPYCTIFGDEATSLTLCHINTRAAIPLVPLLLLWMKTASSKYVYFLSNLNYNENKYLIDIKLYKKVKEKNHIIN